MKDKRLVNWDPSFETAISDLEVENIEPRMTMSKYDFKNDKFLITIATTRPETMLGDTAIAVHPKMIRYKDLLGKKLLYL